MPRNHVLQEDSRKLPGFLGLGLGGELSAQGRQKVHVLILFSLREILLRLHSYSVDYKMFGKEETGLVFFLAISQIMEIYGI